MKLDELKPQFHKSSDFAISKNMKNTKTLILLLLTIILLSCKAQTLPMSTDLQDIPNGAYVKDSSNELQQYVGVYKANFQNNEITLSISKQENKLEERMNKSFYRDVLIVQYSVKNSLGTVLQSTFNGNNSFIEFYSTGTWASQNKVIFYYSGTHCSVGWGDIYLSKINSTQISWEYRPDDILTDDCPAGTDKTIYLPETKDLIFTKQ